MIDARTGFTLGNADRLRTARDRVRAYERARVILQVTRLAYLLGEKNEEAAELVVDEALDRWRDSAEANGRLTAEGAERLMADAAGFLIREGAAFIRRATEGEGADDAVS